MVGGAGAHNADEGASRGTGARGACKEQWRRCQRACARCENARNPRIERVVPGSMHYFCAKLRVFTPRKHRKPLSNFNRAPPGDQFQGPRARELRCRL
jgi:hypothetical protein